MTASADISPGETPELLAEALELSQLPGVSIEMSGDGECLLLYRDFTSRHRRWRLIQNKRWGVALIELPRSIDDYLKRTSRLARRRIKHAKECGYSSPALTLKIASRDPDGQPFGERATRTADASPLLRRGDGAQVSSPTQPTCSASSMPRTWFRHTSPCGTAARWRVIERLLGHADALEQGVMYLLVLALSTG